MTLGETHFNWDPDVGRVVQQLLARFPGVTCNTYVDHPFVGWDSRSIDVWGPGGRGSPLALQTGHRVVRYIMRRRSAPFLRHYIYLHRLWTSFGGPSYWEPADHLGRLRHVHLTFWFPET